jgi:RNA polymerase sigma factor (sigma-70 family)
MIQKAVTEQATRDNFGDYYKSGDYYIVVGPPLGIMEPLMPEATANTGAQGQPAQSRKNRPLSGQQRRQRIIGWRKVLRKNHATIRQHSRGERIAGGDASEEAAVRAYHAMAAAKAESAQADFYRRSKEHAREIGELSDVEFEEYEFGPYMESRFIPQGHSCPLEVACHRWYRAQYEATEVEKLIATAKPGHWDATLTRAHHLHERLLCADAAWLILVALYREAAKPDGQVGPEAPEDWLVAWAAETVGVAYLGPRMRRADPGANQQDLREKLLGDIWGSVLTLWIGGLSAGDFCQLPQNAANEVCADYVNTTDNVKRMIPKTRRVLEDMHRPEADAADPELIVMERAKSALVAAAIQGLPTQQRRVMELRATGMERIEIAAAMGIEDETVKSHLSYAYKRLRLELAPLFKTGDDSDGP